MSKAKSMFPMAKGDQFVIMADGSPTFRARCLQSDDKGAVLGVEDGTTIDLGPMSDISFGIGRNRGKIFFHG